MKLQFVLDSHNKQKKYIFLDFLPPKTLLSESRICRDTTSFTAATQDRGLCQGGKKTDGSFSFFLVRGFMLKFTCGHIICLPIGLDSWQQKPITSDEKRIISISGD